MGFSMNPVNSLRLPATLPNLAAIRSFVQDRAAALGVPEEAVLDMIQAVDELTTNTVEHGYRGGPGEIEVEVEVRGQRLLVYVRDQAPPFDPTGAPTPDITIPLEQRRPGGLGIHLAREMTDEMRHRLTARGGNEVTLVKTFST